jgi:hypothetical protein
MREDLQMKRSLVFLAGLMALLGGLVGQVRAQDEEAKKFGLFAVGGGLSYAKPSDMGAGVGFGLHADIGNILPNMAVFPVIGFWSRSEAYKNSYGYLSESKLKVRELSLEANVHYYLNPEANTNFYIGAGAGYYSSKVTVEGGLLDYTGALKTNSGLGFGVLGGVEVPMGEKARFGAELKYKVDGNMDLLKVTTGVTIELGR